MRVLRITAVNELGLAEAADPVPATGEAVVAIRAAALNHRDVWIKRGEYAGVTFPCIPGSDGAGVVVAVGPRVDKSWIGREVVIYPAFDWGPRERAQGASFSILGLPRAGTLAERVAVPVAQLAAKPEHLSWEEAAALPLAGLTAWRALVYRGRLESADRVLVTGIGGGVALFALQLAVARGAEVWVTSSSQDKISRAVALGASGGFIYTRSGWTAEALQSPGPFDLIVDSAGGEGFGNLIDIAAPGGRIVFYGATRGNPPILPARKIFWKQLSLLGTTMGSPLDWAAMTAFLAHHTLKPVIDTVFPFERSGDAFTLMERGDQFGKIIIKVG